MYPIHVLDANQLYLYIYIYIYIFFFNGIYGKKVKRKTRVKAKYFLFSLWFKKLKNISFTISLKITFVKYF